MHTLPHMQRIRVSLMPRIATCSKTSYAAFNARHFSSSPIAMVKKAYFEVEWTGPELQVDASGKVTGTGASKRKFVDFYSCQLTDKLLLDVCTICCCVAWKFAD